MKTVLIFLMLSSIVLFLLFKIPFLKYTRIGNWLLNFTFELKIFLSTIFRKKSITTIQSGYKSIALLGLLLKFNPWPIVVQLDNQGVYIRRRAWHCLWVKMEYYPYKMIYTLNLQEYFSSFSKIKLLLKNTITENESYELGGFFKVQCARRLAEDIFQQLGQP